MEYYQQENLEEFHHKYSANPKTGIPAEIYREIPGRNSYESFDEIPRGILGKISEVMFKRMSEETALENLIIKW